MQIKQPGIVKKFFNCKTGATQIRTRIAVSTIHAHPTGFFTSNVTYCMQYSKPCCPGYSGKDKVTSKERGTAPSRRTGSKDSLVALVLKTTNPDSLLPGQTSREGFLQKPTEVTGPGVILTHDHLSCFLVSVSHQVFICSLTVLSFFPFYSSSFRDQDTIHSWLHPQRPQQSLYTSTVHKSCVLTAWSGPWSLQSFCGLEDYV